MDNQRLNTHDDFFKVAFSRESNVIDYFRSFFKEKLVKKLDFSTLKLSNTSYVTPQLEEYFADVVWDCTYQTDGKKVPIKATFLFEHKSYVPKFPHLQLLRYMLQIWDECEKNQKPLIPVIPIIVYHNKKDKHWNYKPFSEYFKGIDAELLPFIPHFDYQLTDLTRMTAEQIMAMNVGLLMNALLTLQFGAKEDYVVENIKTLILNVKNVETDEYLHSFFFAQLVYVLKNNELGGIIKKHIVENYKNTVDMNAYDELIKEERAEALEQGIEQGIEQGFSKKELQVVTNILQAFPDWEDEKIADLAGSTIENVQSIRATLELQA